MKIGIFPVKSYENDDFTKKPGDLESCESGSLSPRKRAFYFSGDSTRIGSLSVALPGGSPCQMMDTPYVSGDENPRN